MENKFFENLRIFFCPSLDVLKFPLKFESNNSNAQQRKQRYI